MNGSPAGLVPGSSEFRRAQTGLFMTGLATFALLYVVQPLLPLLGREFRQGAGTASLALSVSTVTLAAAVLPMAWAAGRFGRARILQVSLLSASAVGIGSAFAPNWIVLLGLRGLLGLALAGIPAAALAWINDEIHPRHTSFASGLYIAGTTVGGMTGRLVSGGLAGEWGWRTAIFGVGALSLGCAIAATVLLPRGRPSAPKVDRSVQMAGSTRGRRPRVRLYLVGGLAMAAFVGMYNVLAYRLEAPPYLLTPAVASLVFLAYLTGTFSSAQAGRVTARIGTRPAMVAGLGVAALGVGLTLFDPLPVVILGVCLLTAGFFIAHSIASGQAPRSAPSPPLAAGLYVLFYYVGSSIGGPLLGFAYADGDWSRAAATAAILLILAIAAVPPGQTRVQSGTDRGARPEPDPEPPR